MMGATTLGSPDANKGLNGTKKTITDFFGKSPQNSPTIESKPKDLLGYFSKPSCGKSTNLLEEPSPLTSSPKSYKKGTPVGNSPNSVGSKNKKRKHNGKELIVIDGLAEDDNVKPKKRKCNKDVELFQTDSSPPLKEKNPFSSVLIVENENHSEENGKEKTVAGAKETNAKNTQGKSSHRSLAKPKRSDGKMNVYKWTRPLDSSVSGKNPGDELSSVMCEDVDYDKSTGASKSLELSYEEYLLSQEMDTEPEKIEDEIEEKEDIPENLEDAVSVSSCQKSTKPTSIATFFSQLPKSKKETPVSQTVTVCADIHPEPRQKPPSPIKKPAGSKSQEMVLKPISLDTKSRLKELDSIVVLSSDQPSEIKELPPSDGIKQKSFKKSSANAERGSKKSGKNKVPSSAPDVKGGKSSQCLLNFGSQKPLLPKPEDGTTAVENMNGSQSAVTSPMEKNKSQSDVSIIKPEEDPSAIEAGKEIVDAKTSLKRKRGRGRKNSTVAPEKNIAMGNKKKQSAKNPRDKNGIKEFQITEECDVNIVDTNVEVSVSKKEEEEAEEEEIKLDKISSNEEEKAESSSKEDISDNSEKEPKRKSNRNTSAADANAATSVGTRRSARLREHKTLARPSPTEETQSQPITPKTHKEKRKSDSLNTAGSSEKSKEASSKKESNIKQVFGESNLVGQKMLDHLAHKMKNQLDLDGSLRVLTLS